MRVEGMACDEYSSASGWVSYLAAIVTHDGADDNSYVITYGPVGGPYQTNTLDQLNPGDSSRPWAYVTWPRVAPGVGADFQDALYIKVEYPGGLFERTMTLDEARALTPACIPVIDTPGAPG